MSKNCNCHKKLCEHNNLAINFPEVAAEWNYFKNGNRRPEEFTNNSNFMAWWKCKKYPEHEWQTRINKKRQCPYCSGRLATKENNFLLVFPKQAKEWHPTKNGNLKPEDVTPQSNKRAWWKCSLDPTHEWESTISDRKYCGCPYCNNNRVSDTHNLLVCFPKVAAQWHPTKNGKFKPEDFTPANSFDAWWKCDKDSRHEWKASICQRRGGKRDCPYCSGNKVNETNNLLVLYPEIAKFWHPIKNENNKPDQFTSGSNFQAWWLCPNDNEHEWQMPIKYKVKTNSPCPFCNGKKVDSKNNLFIRFPKIAASWHPTKNGDLRPENITAHSSKKVWWLCEKDHTHEWETTVKNRTSLGNNCPYHSLSVSKPETKWLNILNVPQKNRHIRLIIENKPYNFDAYDPKTNTIYEFYGDYWHGNPIKFKENAINKRNKQTFGTLYKNTLNREIELKKMGFNLITIWESDFKKLLYVDAIKQVK